ncbi:MAG TPA: hypothetical protein VFS20_04040, partial [Longimicrobium sp.]|nr:hypothetical protein [Longimicrobium sp.]
MSEFAGIVSRDGSPLDPVLVDGVLAGLARFGAASVVSGGPRHALLRAETSPAPAGTGWSAGPPVVAFARLDGRAELARELRAAGAQPGATDPELIAAAYAAWGEECCRHLLGDFCFLLWDEARGALFAAGDPLGVRRLYHAEAGGAVVVAGSLRALLAVPGVPRELDHRFVGDLLLFGANREPAWTAYRAIAALPPAHALTAGPGGVRTAR